MLTFVTIIHIIVAIFLVFLVLIQDSKGAMGGVLGQGSSQSIFGAGGATNVLVKITRYIAIVFAATCLLLSWYNANQKSSSVIDDAQVSSINVNDQKNEKVDQKNVKDDKDDVDIKNSSKEKPLQNTNN